MNRLLIGMFITHLLSCAAVAINLEDEGASNDDVAVLSFKGAAGAGAAAYKLFLYYSFDVPDDDRADFWENVSAMNGDIDAQYGLWIKYKSSSDVRVRLNACYWLLRAKQGGHPKTTTISISPGDIDACARSQTQL